MSVRRAVAAVLAFSAVGVLLSQAVAVLCVYRAGSAVSSGRPLAAGELQLPDFLVGAWPRPAAGSVARGTTIGHATVMLICPIDAPPDFRDDPPGYGLEADAFGLPCRSLVWYRAFVVSHGANGGVVDLRAFAVNFASRAGLGQGIPMPAWWPTSQRCGAMLPVRPIWGGLAVNGVLYAIVAAALAAVPGRIRRLSRRGRGLCEDCGYLVAGLQRCPECGRPAGSAACVVRRGPGA